VADQSVRTDVAVFGKSVVLTLSTDGVGSLPITLEPQAASELAELLARNAFEAFHGKPARTDISHLHAQVRNKVTDHMRGFLAKRLEVMLNSLREDRNWSNEKLAGELVDIVLTKVA
jgi:hypothetical protein